jgi:hypothetical protein
MKTSVMNEEEFAYTPSAGRRSFAKPSFSKPTLGKSGPDLVSGNGKPDNGAPAPRKARLGKSSPGSGRRRNMPIVIILLVGLIAVAALYLKPTGSNQEPAQQAPSTRTRPSLTDSTPVVFRYAFAQGDTRSYNMTMDMNFVPHSDGAEPFSGMISSTMTINVVKRLADGASVLDVSISNVKVEPPTDAPSLPNDGAQMRITLAPDGRVLYFEGTGGVLGGVGSISNQLFAGGSHASDEAQSQFLFPRFADKAVKPGDTWKESSSFELPFGNEKTTVTATGKHRGFQNSSYGRVAKLHYAVQSPLNVAFTLSDLAKIAAQERAPGSDPIGVPTGLANAKFTMAGDMTMNADTLVLPSTSDLVKLDGTMKTTMHLAIEGIPSEAETVPRAMDFDATVRMSIVRIDRAGA